jgi:peptidoglycan hydrolase-like protein with peptidoglycan-binding domain
VLRVAIITAVAFGLIIGGTPGVASAAEQKKHSRKKRKGVSSSKTKAAAPTKSSSKKRSSSSRKGGKKRTFNRADATPRRSQQRNPTPERYKEIQGALIAKGYLKGPATGVWDADSIGAIKRFQGDQKLDADGKIEALTLIALGLGPKNSPIANNSQAPVRRAP